MIHPTHSNHLSYRTSQHNISLLKIWCLSMLTESSTEHFNQKEPFIIQSCSNSLVLFSLLSLSLINPFLHWNACAFGMYMLNLILLNDPLPLCIPILQCLAQVAQVAPPPRAFAEGWDLNPLWAYIVLSKSLP